MVKNRFTFVYDHAGSVSGSNVSLEMNCNCSDIHDVVDQFKDFLRGAGFSEYSIKEAFIDEDYKFLYENEKHIRQHYQEKVERERKNENDSEES